MDIGPASGQYRLCGGTLQEVSIFVGGAAQLPKNRAEPRHQARGEECKGRHVGDVIIPLKASNINKM